MMRSLLPCLLLLSTVAHAEVCAADDLAARVCERASAGQLDELGKLGAPDDLGFVQQWRDPAHHTPGPAPVRVLATGPHSTYEKAQLARYAETMKAIAAEQKGAKEPCKIIHPLRGATFEGQGWGRAADAVAYVAKDRSWGVTFWFGPAHGASGGARVLRTIERWDADRCPVGQHELPALCLAEPAPEDTCRCAR